MGAITVAVLGIITAGHSLAEEGISNATIASKRIRNRSCVADYRGVLKARYSKEQITHVVRQRN